MKGKLSGSAHHRGYASPELTLLVPRPMGDDVLVWLIWAGAALWCCVARFVLALAYLEWTKIYGAVSRR